MSVPFLLTPAQMWRIRPHVPLSQGIPRVRFALAPPLSFVVDPAEQPGLPGERVTGALLHRLQDEAVETLLLSPEGMDRPCLDDIRAETYPRAEPAAA